MLESRSSYGFYGEHGGLTGEVPPTKYKSGWNFGEYVFRTSEPEWMCNRLSIKACDYAHALKQAKKYARDNKCEILGVTETYGVPTEEKKKIEWHAE